MADMTSLAVGDRLVYPNQGLCTVTEIKSEEIAGQKLTFVSLVIIETGAKVKVPREKLEKNGVRRVSSSDDVKRVIDYLKSDAEKASLDWKKRARDNTARLSEGGLLGLAKVVNELQVLSELRALPPKEREQYNDARHLFVEELSSAMGVNLADAEDALDILLFVPGKDRPKRSIEEFQGLGGEDDELGLDGDLLGLDGEEAAEEPAEEKSEQADADGEGEADEAEGAKKKKTAAKPAKGNKAPPPDEDEDEDEDKDDKPVAATVEAKAKKRGQPARVKAEPVKAEPAPAPPSKKQDRPTPSKSKPKPKPKVVEPKRRGRPSKGK
jgi:CarD family transcriptional regulator